MASWTMRRPVASTSAARLWASSFERRQIWKLAGSVVVGLARANQSMPEGEAVAFAAVQAYIMGANCCQVCQPSSCK